MDNNLEVIEKHLFSDSVLAKFTPLLDKRARHYMESVFLLVKMRPDLQKCTMDSIENAALQAASLELSCDPSLKQAHLIPQKKSKKVDDRWVTWYEAQFKPHYLGYYTLAMRTNKYRTIDVVATPPGYELVTSLELNQDVLLNEKGQPAVYIPSRAKIEKVGGWYGYFVTRNGQIKRVYMTVEEIHAYVKKHNPKGYMAEGSLWNKPEHVETMEKKTVLLKLLMWAEKNGITSPELSKVLTKDDEVVDVEAEDVTAATPATTEALPNGTDQGVDEAFPNGSKRLMELREKAKADPTTAYWEAAKAAGLDNEAGKSVLKECGGDFAVAFNKLAAAYAEVIK